MFLSLFFSAKQQLRGRALLTQPFLDRAFSLPFNLPHPRCTFIPCARCIHPPSHLAFGKHGRSPRASLSFLVATDRGGEARCVGSNLGVLGCNASEAWTASFGIHWKRGRVLVGPTWWSFVDKKHTPCKPTRCDTTSTAIRNARNEGKSKIAARQTP